MQNAWIEVNYATGAIESNMVSQMPIHDRSLNGHS